LRAIAVLSVIGFPQLDGWNIQVLLDAVAVGARASARR
jgi:hypothetical protein